MYNFCNWCIVSYETALSVFKSVLTLHWKGQEMKGSERAILHYLTGKYPRTVQLMVRGIDHPNHTAEKVARYEFGYDVYYHPPAAKVG